MPSPGSRASTARRSSTGSAASGSRPLEAWRAIVAPEGGTPIPCGPIPFLAHPVLEDVADLGDASDFRPSGSGTASAPRRCGAGGAPARRGRGLREPGLPGDRRVPARTRAGDGAGRRAAQPGTATPSSPRAPAPDPAQERLGEAARRGAGALRGLRPARGGRRGPARPAARRAPRASPRSCRGWTSSPSASRRSWRRPTGRPRGAARDLRERGVEGLMLKRRDAAYGATACAALVEVEGGPLHHRHRPRLRPARPRPPRPLHRLHPRGLSEEGESSMSPRPTGA